MIISSAQCRAARALLGWSQDDLAASSNVATATIATFETGKRLPYERTLDDIHAALVRAGVIFIDSNGEGPGVRLSKAKFNADSAARAGAAMRKLSGSNKGEN